MGSLRCEHGFSCVTLVIFASLSTLATGCTTEPKPERAKKPEVPLVPVKGKISIDGVPFTRGMIVFSPDPPSTERFSLQSKIGPDGGYELFYQEKQPGAPKGTYKVFINLRKSPNINNKDKIAQVIPLPEEYGSLSTTPLSVEVTDAMPAGAFDFDLLKK